MSEIKVKFDIINSENSSQLSNFKNDWIFMNPEPQNHLQMVKEWQEKFCPEHNSDFVEIPEKKIADCRINLIEEEFSELKEAMKDGDLLSALDALCDLQYVLNGTILALGLEKAFAPAFEEVHRSNMSKMNPDGTVTRREDGKVIKPATYSPANLKPILEQCTLT